jgi:hypothetical protein
VSPVKYEVGFYIPEDIIHSTAVKTSNLTKPSKFIILPSDVQEDSILKTSLRGAEAMIHIFDDPWQ